MPPITLVRPDGSLLDIDPKEAGPLLASGYRQESQEEYTARQTQIANERYWSSPGEKLKTAIEGAGSGLTLGATDKLLQWWKGDEGDWKQRAEYNPGTRIAGEIGGAVLGAIPTGGESLAELAPVALLSRGAEATAEATKLGRVGQGLVRGGVEGAGFGLGGEISHSALTGDDLTVEGALAGMGWGAVYGGGITAIGSGIMSRVVAKRAAVEAAVKAEESAANMTRDAWGGLRASLHDTGEQIGRTFKTAEEMLSDKAGLAKKTFNQAAEIRNNFFNEMTTTGADKYLLAEKKAGIQAFKNMEKALARKDYAGLEENATRFEESLNKIRKGQELFQGSLPGVWDKVPTFENPYSVLSHSKAAEALNELSTLGVARDTLKGLPVTPGELAKMTPTRAEKMFAAVDSVLGSKSAELEGARTAITQGIGTLSEHLGVSVEGGPATQFRATWETLRGMEMKGAKATAEAAAEGRVPWLRGLEARAGGVAAAKMVGSGGGFAGRFLAYQAGKQIAMGLLGLKGAVLGSITSSAEKWVPRVGRGLEIAGSRAEPLAVRLDGTVDRGKKERGKLMKERAEEIRAAAGSVRDTLYKAVIPMDAHAPEFAAAMHQKTVAQFDYLLNQLPKDPGNAYSMLKSIYSPDAVAMEKFARVYEAFHDPVGVLTRAIDKLQITPEAAEGMKNMWSALWTHGRVEMLTKLSDPAVAKKVDYQTQVRLGTLMDLPLHSSMTPQFIASQQQMYAERNQKLPMNPQPGAGGGSGGRPPGGGSPYSSDAQKITNH